MKFLLIKKVVLSFAVYFLLANLFPAHALLAQSNTVEKSMKMAKPTLSMDFALLMDAIREESPMVYQRLNSIPRKEALQKIMTALDSGISTEQVSSNKTSSSPVLHNTHEQYPCLKITNCKIPYFRIDTLNEQDLSSINADILKSTSKTNNGVILDLRTATSGSLQTCISVASSFANTKRKIVTLVSQTTSGMPALIPVFLKNQGACVVSMGTRAMSPIFPVSSIKVNGVIWQIPIIPDELKDFSPYPISPDLERIAMPRLDYYQLKKKPDDLSSDSLLRLATDFLIMNSVIQQ